MPMEYGGVIIPALVVGLVEVVKLTEINKRWIPLISLILGLVFGVGVMVYTGGDILAGVLNGIALGLSAIGMYSGTKNTFEDNDYIE